MSSRLARSLVWALALIPLLAFMLGVGTSDFASLSSVLNLLGRLTGVLGLAFLLLAAGLSARVPGFDQPFGGLTSLWHTHHLLGAASLLLLLAHPILLALSASTHGQSVAIATLFPPLADMATWSGWLALILMMIFLAPSFSFFGKPNYERWKKSMPWPGRPRSWPWCTPFCSVAPCRCSSMWSSGPCSPCSEWVRWPGASCFRAGSGA